MNMNTNNKIEISVTLGLQFDRDHNPVSPALANKAVTEVAKRFSQKFGGVTIRESAGVYVHTDGQLCRENVAEFVTCCDDSAPNQDAARAIAIWAKVTLNQECVCLTLRPVRFELI